MNSDPKPLTVVGATDLERSLLKAARREQPSPELTARMAAGLGISTAVALTAASAPVAAAPVVAAKSMLGAWVSAGVVAAAVAAGVVGVRLSAAPEKPVVHTGKAVAAVIAAPADNVIEPSAPVIEPSAPVVASRARIEKPRRRVVAPAAPAPAADLRDQIALIDAARSAVTAGSSDRALALLRRYDVSFPGGAFQPEAQALRIEALSQDGRNAEARALARDFLARYPRSPVAQRVARIAQK